MPKSELMMRIDSGEMKIVEAQVLLVVPNHISHDIVENNVHEGVAFKIEEHQFFIDGDLEEVENDITLLKVNVVDINLERKNHVE